MDFDRLKSIEDLENDHWASVDTDIPIVVSIFNARKIPVGELTADALRLLVSQQVALPYTVALAFEKLREDPLLEATLYEGDLLSAVISAEPAFWKKNGTLKNTFRTFLKEQQQEIEMRNTEDTHRQLLKMIREFIK